MHILRLHPFGLYRSKYESINDLQKKIKRVKALKLSMPNCKKVLYYEESLRVKAEDFASIIGDVELKPIEEMLENGQEEYRIIMKNPIDLSQDLFNKTGVRILFDMPMAVLTKEEENSRESIIWSRPAKDWIFFAYPAEIIVPARQGSGISLQDLLLPKIEKGLDTMVTRLDDFFKNPDEVETIHQYRVSIRSFRALISMVKNVLPINSYLKIQDNFRQKARDVALLREIDVLIEEWDKVRTPEQIAFRQAMVEEREKEKERLLAYLRDTRAREEIQQGVNQFINALSMTAWHQLDGIQLMDERLHNWYRFTLESLWELKEFNLPYVHRIRLKSKKYRYVAEFYDEYMTSTQIDHHKSAKARQSVLGKVCDALRNQEAVEELMGNFSPEAKEEAKTFIALEKAREDELLESLGLRFRNPDKLGDLLQKAPKKTPKVKKPEKTEEKEVSPVKKEAPKRVDKIVEKNKNVKKEEEKSPIALVIGLGILVIILLVVYFLTR